MRIVLTFIYTGTVSCLQLDADALGALSVACEYELSGLIHLCEESIIRQLTETTVKDALQFAHLHGRSELKQSCFEFVEENCAKVLMHPSMMSLATEDTELWAELGKAITPDDDDTKG